mgnify:CR=1 FL=1
MPALVAVALVVAMGLDSPARAAGPRFASPTGTTAQNCLTVATACNIEKAIGGAVFADDITILSGVYTTSTVLGDTDRSLNIHGEAGRPRPVINSSASSAISFPQSASGVRISDLTINHTGSQYGLNLFTTSVVVQRVSVYSNGAVACSPGISGTVRDSLCVTSANDGIALDDSWAGSNETWRLRLRNVTAVATGAGSFGIRADVSGNGANLDIDARNVIASGVTADVRSSVTDTSTADSDVDLVSSNYDVTQVGTRGFVTAAGTGTNQTAAPVFRDPNYHQAPASPTINAGTADIYTGTTDIDGEARPAGGAGDIGADEYYADTTPPDTVLTHAPKPKSHRRKGRFSFSSTEWGSFVCKVDRHPAGPCGSPFKKKYKRYGRHHITITAVDVTGNADPTPVTYTWKVKKKRKRHHHR